MKSKNVDVRIFISYAHLDPLLFRDALVSLLRWPGVSVMVWTDEKITPGSKPDKEIRAALDNMDIFVPMITPFFEASSYIQKVEIPVAKRRYNKGEVLIAPVVISNPGEFGCKWLLSLEHLPHKQKSWVDIRKESFAVTGFDEALRLLRDGIWKLVQEIRNRQSNQLIFHH